MAKNTKARLLELLERHRDQSLSGEEMARALQVSRTAVWKAVKELKAEGCRIEAVTNRGYRLLPESNLLTRQSLLPFLPAAQLEHVYIHSLVESTNLEAKKLAVEGAPHGAVVIADTQSEGRGRRGRAFFSPPGKGLYLSVLLRLPTLHMEAAGTVTTAAAVAVSRAILSVTGRETGIKWVNDILLEDRRKVCGILTESINDLETGAVECVVMGAGINVSTRPEEFPPELRETAGALCPGSPDGSLRSRLAAELIGQLRAIVPGAPGYLEEYRRRCVVLGKTVTVQDPRGPYSATALAVEDDGSLRIRRPGGELLLRSGEVSIQL